MSSAERPKSDILTRPRGLTNAGKSRRDTVVPFPIPDAVKKRQTRSENPNQIQPRELVDTLLATSPNAILIVHPQTHNIIQFNNNLFKLAPNLTEADVIALPNFFNSDTRSYIAAGDTDLQDHAMETEKGHSIQVDLKITPVYWEDTIVLIVEIIDITNETEKNEILKLREEVRTMKDELLRQQEQSQAQHETDQEQLAVETEINIIARAIAHDFNNLLCVILGSTTLIQTENTLTEPNIDFELLQSSTNRAIDLCRRFMRFSSKLKINPKTINLKHYAAKALSILKLGKAKYKIKGEVVFDNDDDCRCEADPSLIEDMMGNLIRNAQDAMTSDGKIRISVNSMDQETLENTPWNLQLNEDCVCICVEDNGSGIAPGILSRIFERNFSTKEMTDTGFGIGLATVRNIVEEHNGEICVQSETGPRSFTKFFIFLPKKHKKPTVSRQ